MSFQLSTRGRKAHEIEKDNGGFLQTPGWYRAVVVEIVETPGKPEVVCKYAVSAGPHEGATCSQWLTMPEGYDDEAKAKRAADRLCMIAERLGLWDGESEDPVIEWDDATGKEVVIHVEQGKPKEDGTGGKAGIAYAGVFPLDHAKIPDEARKALRLPAAKVDGVAAKLGGDGTKMPKAKAKPKYDVSDL